MEVGAVKQAYNNEVIHLKQKFNQAKIQIIHKLTRKAKTLTEKKCPENIKEKFTKKAKSAVEEVLILKKITNKELAKFAVTHKGTLQQHLNKPTVDKDKACARLLLHKCLEDKYTFFRSQYSNISIEDLVMSREERRKMKKEEKEKQKNKKKAKEERKKNKSKNSEGEWNVEDIEVDDLNASKKGDVINTKILNTSDDLSDESDLDKQSDVNDISDDYDDVKVENSENEDGEDNDEEMNSGEDNDNEEMSDSDGEHDVKSNSEQDDNEDEKNDSERDDNEMEVTSELPNKAEPESLNEDSNVEIGVKPDLNTKVKNNKLSKAQKPQSNKKPPKEDNRKKIPKKSKEGIKNKNFSEKILAKKVKKDYSEPAAFKKIIDPFFKTSSGENYVSLAEPREADEILEVHRQGNRQMRRAKIFGHELKFKPRRDYSKNNDRFNNRNNKFDEPNNSFRRNDNNFRQNGYRGDRNRFEKQNDSQNEKWSRQDRGGIHNNNKNSSFNNRNVPQQRNVEKEPEKLHPSWEAKKKKSGILPFEGKKIVFD